jgi:aspartyl-tRNA(Asn)/glutamyl-tRNA(Gln) amidotransferase subunit A
MVHLEELTIKSFHDGLVKKKFSALEIAQAFFRRIKEADGKIGAYLNLNEESALREAEATDVAIAEGENVGVLAGVPLAVKDNMLVKGAPTTAASKMLEGYVASYDAGVIRKLKSEKTVFLGRTNMDEFAMGSSTENSAFHPTKNPHDTARVPGGSSGGSAAAVGANMALAALGSDTGGSIRQPAAFCGVVGLKPTYGAVSRSGLIAMCSSLDQIGPITKTVEDAAILFGAIAGQDPLDATSASHEYGDDLLCPKLKTIKKLIVGIPEEYFGDGISQEVRSGVECAIEKIKSLGLAFKKISLPHTKYALSAYYIVMPAEVSSNLARFDGIRYAPKTKGQELGLRELYFKNRGLGFGTETKRRIILGTFVLSSGYYDAYYEKAQRVRSLVKRDFKDAFEDVDIILVPVTPTPAFKIGEKINDPLSMYLSDIFTIPVNLAGLPAISIPVKKYACPSSELPIGFQLIGKWWHETDILGLGQFYEKINV